MAMYQYRFYLEHACGYRAVEGLKGLTTGPTCVTVLRHRHEEREMEFGLLSPFMHCDFTNTNQLCIYFIFDPP